MIKLRTYLWPFIGLCAVVFSAWLLYHELRGISIEDVGDGLSAIPLHRWLLAGLSTLLAYMALAGYDHIALLHLGRRVPFFFVTVCSFTTYALAHNIGGSVLSGAVIRYRAYVSKGLTGQEVGILVGLCSFTFVLGVAILAGILLISAPEMLDGFIDVLPISASRTSGVMILALVGLYVAGSWLGLRPLRLGRLQISYPKLPIVARQMIIGPAELMAAAAIIYFALPAAGNPGYFVVLGVFIISFSAALLSHAPGGLGVLEIVFFAGLPHMDPAELLAALLVFRLFYLIVPLALALLVVVVFERSQFYRGQDPSADQS